MGDYEGEDFDIELAEWNSEGRKERGREKVSQEQVHGLLFEEKLSWKAIIYDLINTEQLDPWDIDISLLANKYLEKVKKIEEANFFVSSQVLLAAAILLRLKSDRLLDYYIPALDAILSGKKKEEEKKYIQERIELGEEIPGLVARTPLPRYKKISLDELMKALGHAINTENRRIRKVVLTKQQEMEADAILPKTRINIKDKMREVYWKLKGIFPNEERVAFSKFAENMGKEEKIATFVPLLHLDNQKKVWLEQNKAFDEIWILLYKIYEKNNAELLEEMRKEVIKFEKEEREEEKIIEEE